VRGAYCGGSLSVYALDVGAFDFLLIILAQERGLPRLLGFQFSGQIIAVWEGSVKPEILQETPKGWQNRKATP